MRAFAAIKSDPFGNDAFGDEAIRPLLVLTAVAYQYRLHDLRCQQCHTEQSADVRWVVGSDSQFACDDVMISISI